MKTKKGVLKRGKKKTTIQEEPKKVTLVEEPVYDLSAQIIKFSAFEPNQECFISALAINPENGYICVVDHLVGVIRVYNDIGTLQGTYGKDELVKPWDIFITCSGQMAVSDPGDQDIKIFSKKGTLLIGSKRNVHIQLPFGIDYHPYTKETIVADMAMGCVFVHDQNGDVRELLGTGKKILNKKGQVTKTLPVIRSPTCISYDLRGNIFVANNDTNTIFSFGTNSMLRFAYNGCSSKFIYDTHKRGTLIKKTKFNIPDSPAGSETSTTESVLPPITKLKKKRRTKPEDELNFDELQNIRDRIMAYYQAVMEDELGRGVSYNARKSLDQTIFFNVPLLHCLHDRLRLGDSFSRLFPIVTDCQRRKSVWSKLPPGHPKSTGIGKDDLELQEEQQLFLKQQRQLQELRRNPRFAAKLTAERLAQERLDAIKLEAEKEAQKLKDEEDACIKTESQKSCASMTISGTCTLKSEVCLTNKSIIVPEEVMVPKPNPRKGLKRLGRILAKTLHSDSSNSDIDDSELTTTLNTNANAKKNAKSRKDQSRYSKRGHSHAEKPSEQDFRVPTWTNPEDLHSTIEYPRNFTCIPTAHANPPNLVNRYDKTPEVVNRHKQKYETKQASLRETPETDTVKLQVRRVNAPEVPAISSICVDCNGNLLIADRFRSCIHVVDKKGLFQGFLLTKEHGINEPQVITFNSQGNLIVSEALSGFVKVFDYSELYPTHTLPEEISVPEPSMPNLTCNVPIGSVPEEKITPKVRCLPSGMLRKYMNEPKIVPIVVPITATANQNSNNNKQPKESNIETTEDTPLNNTGQASSKVDCCPAEELSQLLSKLHLHSDNDDNQANLPQLGLKCIPPNTILQHQGNIMHGTNVPEEREGNFENESIERIASTSQAKIEPSEKTISNIEALDGEQGQNVPHQNTLLRKYMNMAGTNNKIVNIFQPIKYTPEIVRVNEMLDTSEELPNQPVVREHRRLKNVATNVSVPKIQRRSSRSRSVSNRMRTKRQ